MTSLLRDRRPSRHGVVMVIVLWSLAIVITIVAAVQILAFRQASMGAATLQRVQARWAARAGVERAIAVLAAHVESPDEFNALSVYRDLEAAAEGELETGAWRVAHVLDGVVWAGPMDEHAKLDLNALSAGELYELDLPGMTQDVIDSIIDWRDEDDEVTNLGAEADFYRNRSLFYEPRNGRFRSIAELELVAGAWPENVRGADTRLDGRFDPESGGEIGWAELLTVSTYDDATPPPGIDARVQLDEVEPDEIAEVFGVTKEQAGAISTFYRGNASTVESILAVNLNDLGGASAGAAGASTSSGRRTGRSRVIRNSGGGGGGGEIPPLTSDELRLIIDQGWIGDTEEIGAGRVNVNTATLPVLEAIFSMDPTLAEDVISFRNGRTGGVTSVVDLLDAGRITPAILGAIGHRLCTTSKVFSITSVGRDPAGAVEVAMRVVVDRSSLPVRILEYREQ